ncbi:MAG: UDP-3-O-(3-hydroxymyristoyl)glucosamine N-acyltransferase [Spirulinaceae cyanobacterium SM2_1_0]|nr:UDP-3-O-(3-hydroxymyristoyl)glucosamine N-acyltransferase [Spirulinaceae cyanobacterium SM2_1_0]
MKFSELLARLELSADTHSFGSQSDGDPELTGVAAVQSATAGTLSYIEGAKFAAHLQDTQASALILPLADELQAQASDRGLAWLATEQPRLQFARAIRLFYRPFQPAPEIHPSAVIDPSAVIGKDVYVGPHAVIQAGVKVGDRACIQANVTIYPEVEIGENTLLHANCTIHERTQIGADCVIHSGAVIGGEGFGFVPTPTGYFKIEQSGYVVLETGVEVGSNSTIDRPTVGETRVGRGVKIDNLVQIGHGSTIGANTVMAAQVGMAGGVKVGRNVVLAGQVGIANQAEIGDGAIATAKAGVHNDIAPGAIVTGIPALPHALFLKASAVYRRLPEIYQTVRQLKKAIR